MDFSLLFDAVELDYEWKQNLALDASYHSIFVFEDNFPDLENITIALLSVDDNRGGNNHVLDAVEIRKAFYKLKKSNAHYQIVDLGCLRPGPEYTDTIFRYQEVIEHLIQRGILPILLNSSQDFALHTYSSLALGEEIDKINLAIIDSKLDIEKSKFREESFVNEILSFPENKLHRFKLLGYQSYLVNPEVKHVFDKLAFEEVRLGALKKDIFVAEPLLRNSHLVSFDLSALKSIEFPANGENSPFGLTAEEACQLTWFSGLSSSLKVFVFSGYREEEDINRISANGLGVMLWYLIEGHYAKVNENLEQDVTQYIVEHQSLSQAIVFVKGKKSDKWWIQINNEFIPCSYKDYQSTTEGILPEVWMREEWR